MAQSSVNSDSDAPKPPASRLGLFYLGVPRVEIGGVVADIKLAKANALLAYLAITGEAHTREALSALLWPDHDTTRAQTSLRSILLTLNTTLGKEWLASERKTIQINPLAREAVWLDVEHFEKTLARCRLHGHPESQVCAQCLPTLAEAVNLYRGDFLSGFSLKDSVTFDEWQSYQTEHLRHAQASAFDRLVRGHAELPEGKLSEGIMYARRWLALDSLHEPASEQLIRLYWRNGQRAEALRQYQTCVQILDQELGVPPSEALQALYRQIQNEESPPQPTRVVSSAAEASVPTTPAPSVNATPLPVSRPLRNFPARLTPFLGRDAERTEIERLLTREPECRLVTLVGPGGMGKTRLAMQAAEDASHAFADGATFVSLAPVSSADFLAQTIADAMEFVFSGSEALETQIIDYVRERAALLVMDNFEHLLEGADFMAEILEAAPRVKILATSQERLNLQGEWLIKLEGLSFPEDTGEDNLERYNAVQLFLQSARRVNPGFNLSDEDQAYVRRICQLVDGMPLAIELAATWVRMLSCQEIVREIEVSLEFLAASKRNVPERHRSLRAVFDHAWRLLSEDERRVLRQMATFRGGFPQDAAEVVAGARLPVLLSLVDRGLLRRAPGGRYHRHPLLWRYALEKLEALPEEKELAHNRHCLYYANLLSKQANALKGTAQKAALDEIDTDIENIRVAWRWGVAHRKESELWQALEGLFLFYDIRSWFQEGADTFGEAVKQIKEIRPGTALLSGHHAALVGKLLTRQAHFNYRLGQTQVAREAWDKSLAMFQRAGPGHELEAALAMNKLGLVLGSMGEFEAGKRWTQESVAIYRQFGDRSGLGTALREMAVVLYWSGEYDYARVEYDLRESLSIFKQLGDLRGVAQTLNVIGVFASDRGQSEEARKYLKECLAINRELNDRRGIAMTLNNLGTVATDLGDFEEARGLIEQSIGMYRAIGNRLGVAHSLDSLGYVECGLGEYALAWGHFQDCLRVELELHVIPDAIETLAGFATVMLKQKRYVEALDLVSFILHHPKSLPEPIEKATNLLSELAEHFSTEELTAAQDRTRHSSQTLEMVTQELLRSLQTSPFNAEINAPPMSTPNAAPATMSER